MDLLFIHQGNLAGGKLHHRPPPVLYHFISAVEIGCVRGDPHLGAHREAVDCSTRGQHLSHLEFIEAAAGQDLDVIQAVIIQDLPHLFADGGDVAAVQAHVTQALAPGLRLFSTSTVLCAPWMLS